MKRRHTQKRDMQKRDMQKRGMRRRDTLSKHMQKKATQRRRMQKALIRYCLSLSSLFPAVKTEETRHFIPLVCLLLPLELDLVFPHFLLQEGAYQEEGDSYLESLSANRRTSSSRIRISNPLMDRVVIFVL